MRSSDVVSTTIDAVHWTAAGAVVRPSALQVRVTPGFAERVRVGAPVPARAMSPEEVDANVRHFTEGRRGPRVRPVRQVVLSGVSDPPLCVALCERVDAWRSLGVKELVVHASAPSVQCGAVGELPGCADRVVLTVSEVSDAQLAALDALALGGFGVSVALTAAVRTRLPELVRCFAKDPPRSLAWVWPFPALATPAPPPAHVVVKELIAAGGLQVPHARGVHLPPCVLPRGGAQDGWRTRNRYYVDADHQLEAALLFFPDLVQWAKPDSCRFCRADRICDGVASRWLEQGLTGPLEPM